MNASEFLGQRDDDARGASHVAELVLVLVLDHLADEFSAVSAQAIHSVVNVFDREHDLPEAQRVRRGNRGLGPDQLRVAVLRQLDSPVAIRGSHHSDVGLDAFEPAEAVHRGTFDRHLALKRHAECGEEGNGGWEIVNDDADMIHSFDRHVPSLLHLVEFTFRVNQVRDVMVGILPEREEILIRLACLSGVALHRGGSCERQVRERPKC